MACHQLLVPCGNGWTRNSTPTLHQAGLRDVQPLPLLETPSYVRYVEEVFQRIAVEDQKTGLVAFLELADPAAGNWSAKHLGLTTG